MNSGCSLFKNNEYTKSIIEGALTENFVFYNENSLTQEDWVLHDVFEDKIYCPKNWTKINRSDVNLVLGINSIDVNSYFYFNRYNRSKEITINYYLNELIKAIKNDKNETFDELFLYELKYENRTFYSVEAETTIDGENYFFCELLWYENNFLYDIGIKFDLEYSEIGLKKYRTILHNTLINGKPLFELDNEVQKVKVVTEINSIN